ncbi:hypothetical protein V8E53_010722 [Lactarius tabidus]|jgi:zinc finger protein CreA/MIG
MPYPPSIPPISVHSSASSSPLRSSSLSPFLPADSKAYFPTHSNPPSNKKKHVCHVCAKAFTTSGHLSRHARIHTGERNHKCPFPGCDTRCSRQDNLQQHYRIHLTPGSRRNSASARAHVMSGVKKHAKAPPVPEAPPDSPPSTPPALELAFVPRVYSSEPSPSMPNLSILYPPAQEYVKQDYQEAVPHPHYFDPRGSPNYGFPRDTCVQPAGSELDSFSPQHRIYTSSTGGLVMAESNPISDMPNTATYGVYGACPPPNHPPPDRLSPAQSIDTSMHADVSLVQPQPRSNLRGLPLHTNLQSIQSHQSPIPSPNSPSPVSSLSMSSHSSEHSPSAYQKHNLTATTVSGMRYPPPQVQNDYTITEHYHSSQFLPTEAEYSRAISTSSWQNRLSDVRGMPATPGEGVEFVL